MNRYAFCVMGIGAGCTAQDVTFEGLGFLHEDFVVGDPITYARSVSTDGAVIVGRSDVPSKSDPTGNCANGPQGCEDEKTSRAFRWTDQGMAALFGVGGEIDCCQFEPMTSDAFAVSPDGEIAGGAALPPYLAFGVAATWNDGTLVVFEDLAGYFGSYVTAVTDGGFAAGNVSVNHENKPFIANGDAVEVLLLDTPEATGTIAAISNAGDRMIGYLSMPADGIYGTAIWEYDGDWAWSWIGDPGTDDAFDMNDEGTIIVGRRTIGPMGEPFVYTDANGIEFLDMPDGSMHVTPTGVSNDGDVIVGQVSPLWSGPAIWTAADGWRELEAVLGDAVPPSWSLTNDSMPRISGDGATIIGSAIDPDGYLQAFRAVIPRDELDSDGDGLLDSWEINGLDVNDDGVIDLDLPAMGADPMYPDLFVEVDVMQNVPLISAAIEDVKFAFATAPLETPEGNQGIILHIDLQTADTFPFEETWDDDFTAFGAVKSVFFGTQAERDDPNWQHIREARMKVFRYCAIVNAFDSGAIGWGEMPGNDFMCAHGGLLASDQRLQASTFMHELGHNLGLHHGGSYMTGDVLEFDPVNNKPNYVSCMNYAFDFYTNENGAPLPLDYSREAMVPLIEDNLDETIGIVSEETPQALTFYGWREPGEQPQIAWVQLNVTGFDWNKDGAQEVGVAVDLNWLGGSYPGGMDPSPGQTLHGRNDWQVIQLPLGDTGHFADGQHVPPGFDELTEDDVTWVRENLPPPPICTADVNGDGLLNILDFVAFQGLFVTQDPGADCDDNGLFNILDFVCFQGHFQAGCG